MKHLKSYKIFEATWDDQEYIQDVISGLKKYNIPPIEMNRIINAREEDILSYRDSGKHPNVYVNELTKELELGTGGFLNQKMGCVSRYGARPGTETQVKYL